MNKNKIEQLFILLVLCMTSFGLLCISGCGGKSCETPKCSSKDVPGGNLLGISVPGYGGCISPGKGCDSCLYPQSHKFISGCGGDYVTEEGVIVEEELTIIGCDTKYYGGGCLGCGQQEKSCYIGYMDYSDSNNDYVGLFYGSSDCDENVIGYGNGCAGCAETGGVGGDILHLYEILEGIE